MVAIPTGTWVDNNVDAGELRKSLGAALVIPGGPTAPRPGRLAGPGAPLTVSPTAPATMAVLVKAGKAHTYRSAAYGPILGLGPDGDVTIPIVAPGSGSQWFRVYLAQRDTASPATDADSLAVVDVIAGAAASSPAKPNLPAGALLLGEVLVPAGATSITAGMVTDLPTWTAPRGGVLPVANQAERVALTTAGLVWPGLEVLELDTGRRLWHDGTRFRYEGDRVTVPSLAARNALTAYAGLAAVVTATDYTAGEYIYDGAAWNDWVIVPTVELTGTGWTNLGSGFPPLRYRRQGREVRIQGTLGARSGGIPQNSPIFTLPLALAPTYAGLIIATTEAATSIAPAVQIIVNTRADALPGRVMFGAAFGSVAYVNINGAVPLD